MFLYTYIYDTTNIMCPVIIFNSLSFARWARARARSSPPSGANPAWAAARSTSLPTSPSCRNAPSPSVRIVCLYTRLPSPILYGVWHKKGGSVGGRILRNARAIVLQ